jgi:pimeloyl-ACP methyl ester carboxylesterase
LPDSDLNHQYATINGLRYHYVRQGAGPPLLLVHGWPGFYYEWRHVIKPLAERFEVVAPDMRGYGETDKPDLPPEEGYTDAAMAEDMLALVDHLGWERANIVTHDFGSVWTQRFARAYPERVGKLVFFQPAYPGIGFRMFAPDRVGESWYMMFHQLPLAEELVGSSRQATEAYLRHFLSHWSYDKNVWTDEEVERFVEAFSRPGALRGGFNCYRAAFRTIGRGLGGDPQIKAPTLVLWGENDSILPLAWSDNLGEFFTNVTLQTVPECGHWLQREKPHVVVREVTRFVLEDGGGPPK